MPILSPVGSIAGQTIIKRMGLDIVIIDDAPFIREAIRTMAETWGMRVIGEAADGVEAMKLLENSEPDVVILDLIMPKKNGITVVKEILESKPHLKILACSTESQKEMALKAIDAGCKGFIGKPFEAKILLKKINEVAAT